MLQSSTIRFAIQALYRIEALEATAAGSAVGSAEKSSPVPSTSTAVATATPEAEEVEALLDKLPALIRVRYRWLRTWTPYPVARLRDGACTGCRAVYREGHAFLRASEPQVACCEQCLRLLILNDLALIA